MDVFDFVYDSEEEAKRAKVSLKSWRKKTPKKAPLPVIESPVKLIVKPKPHLSKKTPTKPKTKREYTPRKKTPHQSTKINKPVVSEAPTPRTRTKNKPENEVPVTPVQDLSTPDFSSPSSINYREGLLATPELQVGLSEEHLTPVNAKQKHVHKDDEENDEHEEVGGDDTVKRFLRSNYEGGTELHMDDMFDENKWI